MKTITQTAPHTFTEALQKLIAGECIGIRPGKNFGYVVAFRPNWMNKQSPDFLLSWRGVEELSEAGIRSDQFLGEWFLVIVDHRTL